MVLVIVRRRTPAGVKSSTRPACGAKVGHADARRVGRPVGARAERGALIVGVELAQQRVPAAAEDVRAARVRAARVAAGGADQHVGAAVAVQVGRAGDSRAELVARMAAAERVQQRAGTAGVEIRHARAGRRVGVRRAGDDVVHAVAVGVAGIGDGIAQVVAGRAGEPVQHRSRAAGVDQGVARAVGRVGLAGDQVGYAVAVDVGELRDGPAEVGAGLSGEGVDHAHRFDERAGRVRGLSRREQRERAKRRGPQEVESHARDARGGAPARLP